MMLMNDGLLDCSGWRSLCCNDIVAVDGVMSDSISLSLISVVLHYRKRIGGMYDV